MAGQTTASSGTYSFTITVTDSQNDQVSQSYSITVGAPVAISGPPTLPVGVLGTGYSGAVFTASGGSGSGYVFGEIGALPAGLTLNSTSGALSGTPTQYGSFSLNVTVTDSKGGTSAPSPYTLVINFSLGKTPNAIYVTNLYSLLLNRTPDAGAAHWLTVLNQGAAPASVVQAIESSTEYLNDVVAGLYQHYLHRAPDSGGLSYWTSQLQGGAPIEQVIDVLVSSPEFFQQAGSSNAGFVTALYQDILNRAPDSAGENVWDQTLNGGTSPASVATAFLTSTEYRSDLVSGYYAQFLRRGADQGGLSYWLKALQAGMSDQAVLASILGSAEGYADWSK